MTDRVATARRAHRRHGFLTQGLCILLPVVVLALIGFLSIRQDKVLAERDAAAQAQAMAEDIADAIWASLTAPAVPGREFGFTVDATGELVFPPPAARLPAPAPFPISQLASNQLRLWEQLHGRAAPRDAVEAGRQFLTTQPPPRFEAAARFRMAGLLAAAGEVEPARSLYAEVSRPADRLNGETGLPLAPLAQIKWLELTSPTHPDRPAALGALCTNALQQPSPVTPFLLRRAAELQGNPANPWLTEWERHELLRSLHASAFASERRAALTNATPALPRILWLGADDPDAPLWRATRIQTNAAGATYDCRITPTEELVSPLDPEAPRVAWLVRFQSTGRLDQLRPSLSIDLTNSAPDPFAETTASVHQRLPAYLGLTLEVAGRTLISSNHLREFVFTITGKGTGRHWTSTIPSAPLALLAQARRFDEGSEAMRIGLYLISPEMLYQRQRARARIFGLLILAAAATSVFGFVSARRAFRRQQQLSDLKSNFVSSVSHELRAPLASVRLMAENLEHGKVSEPARQRDYFRFIVQECRRLGTLIENVLDFARIEQGRKQYEFEPTDVAALVERSVQLMEPMAAARKVALAVRDSTRSDARASTVDAESGAPLLDGPAILQALINLLDNAIKHAPPSSTVTVTLEWRPRPSTLALAVQDQGPGIPPGEHEKIFHRFYRRGPELRRETQGVGIGLSLVKHITEAHGGRVRVESAPGQGSRFILELPVHRTIPSPAPPPTPALHAAPDSHR